MQTPNLYLFAPSKAPNLGPNGTRVVLQAAALILRKSGNLIAARVQPRFLSCVKWAYVRFCPAKYIPYSLEYLNERLLATLLAVCLLAASCLPVRLRSQVRVR